jgi:uncharacterized OsmC-like protein
MASTTSQNKQLNGWNLDQFQSVINMVKENPEAGRLSFETRTKWDAGFGVDGRTEKIGMVDQTIPRRFTFRGDHSPELLGKDTGPTAVETLLAALGSCIAGTYAAQATARGIKIDDLEVAIDGDIDLQGFLQIAPIRAGLSDVSVNIKVKSDADEAKLSLSPYRYRDIVVGAMGGCCGKSTRYDTKPSSSS